MKPGNVFDLPGRPFVLADAIALLVGKRQDERRNAAAGIEQGVAGLKDLHGGGALQGGGIQRGGTALAAGGIEVKPCQAEVAVHVPHAPGHEFFEFLLPDAPVKVVDL
ncbi:MAG: hypothetical protein NTY38_14585 [Acidobacteria bacterium]|nr:hypothetical protein [Acidobacteriota bacterium]